MNLGIIGAGNISATHLRAAQLVPGVVVSAIYSPTLDNARRLAASTWAAVYDTFDAFLAHQPLDFVAIGAPSGMHAEQAIAAAERGLHVLIEKPIDISVERADALIAAADRHGVQVGVFFQDRLAPDLVALKRAIDAGALGRPVLASGRVKWHRGPEYYAGSRWRGTQALDGGGALMNQGIHTVDTLQWLFGPVASVSAAIATRVHAIEVEDTAAAVLRFENGALGTIEAATSVFPGYSRRIELTGSQGTVIVERDVLVGVDLRHPPPDLSPRAPATTTAGEATAAVADATPHARIIEDFVRAVKDGSRPACDARDGRTSVAIVEAIYRSAKTGRAEQPG